MSSARIQLPTVPNFYSAAASSGLRPVAILLLRLPRHSVDYVRRGCHRDRPEWRRIISANRRMEARRWSQLVNAVSAAIFSRGHDAAEFRLRQSQPASFRQPSNPWSLSGYPPTSFGDLSIFDRTRVNNGCADDLALAASYLIPDLIADYTSFTRSAAATSSATGTRSLSSSPNIPVPGESRRGRSRRPRVF